MTNQPQKLRKVNTSEYPPWAPRFWHGMLVGDWLQLVAKNRFRIHPLRLGLATTVTALTAFNSMMRLFDNVFFSKQVSTTKLVTDPLFILGHWRAGTTYLHELLSCDETFATPTTFQCFAANHFLLTQGWMPKIVWFVMPKHRPMDNVQLAWDAPQEDEFALCSMGVASPYLRIAFPKNGDQYLDYLDMEHLTERDTEAWKLALDLFLRRVTLKTGKRLILKSPTHTGRIKLLNAMYPNAKFIHIVRDPRSLYPSTLKLWNSLDDAHGLQFRRHQSDEFVLQSFRRMYGAFERDRNEISNDRISEMRYEDLVANPTEELRRVYQELDLGDFSSVEPSVTASLGRKKNYRTNRYELTVEMEQQIADNFGAYQERYSYDVVQKR